MTDDLPGYVRQWLLDHADMPVTDMAAALDADLRRQFGGGEVYIHRRRKAEHLARLAALPPEATAREVAQALGVGRRRARALRGLTRG